MWSLNFQILMKELRRNMNTVVNFEKRYFVNYSASFV